MNLRISKKQREFLELVADANEPRQICLSEGLSSLPFYIGPNFWWDWDFGTDGEVRRWIGNLESRGLIAIEKGHFVRITDAGRAAIAKATTTELEK